MSERGSPSDLANYLRTAVGLEVYLRGAIRERDPRYLEEARRCALRAMERWNIAPTPELNVLLGVTDAAWSPDRPQEPAGRRRPGS
ncbi:hypothetical protein [Phenylobacterium sp.]|jgi:hypothetical protein|uniref:hypothetical protein n=1 Tax=Phenylobacterium sp. TaxID=1871053 RepID=UPI002EDB0A73